MQWNPGMRVLSTSNSLRMRQDPGLRCAASGPRAVLPSKIVPARREIKRCKLPGMASITFDTLKFADTLKAAGVPDKQAEAEARAVAAAIGEVDAVLRVAH